MNTNLTKYFLSASLMCVAATSAALASNQQDKDVQPRTASKAAQSTQSPAYTLQVIATMNADDARLNKAVKAGNLDAINRLGFCYMNGYGCKVDGKRAQLLFQKAADLGNDRSMSNLAFCLENGIAGKVTLNTINQALDWYRKSAKLNNSTAMCRLGDLLLKDTCNREVTEKDKEEAFSWYKKSAELGDREGMYHYGHCLKNAMACEDSFANKEAALDWFIKSMLAGKVEALHFLGEMYLHGIGCPKNVKSGLFWYEEGAKKGDDCCMSNLAVALFDGILCPKNVKAAEEWFLKAIAAGGSAMNHTNLGALYFTERNYEKALYHLNMGLSKYSTHTLIGFIYLQKKEYEKALNSYVLALEAGERVNQGVIDYLSRKVKQIESQKKRVSKDNRVNVAQVAAKIDQLTKVKSGRARNAESFDKLLLRPSNSWHYAA